MVQLKFQPTKAPSFAGVSDILKNAGLAMDRGFEAAQGMLGSYQEGQQESVDNEVFAELQKLEGREAIDDYFAKGGLKGRRVSPKMMEHMAQMRGTAAVTALNRQSTASSAASMLRQDVVADRNTAEAKRKAAARAEALGMSNAQFEAYEAARRKGAGGGAAAQLNAAAPPVAGGGAAPTTPGGVPTIGDGSRAPAHLVSNESGGSFQATNESVGSGGIKGHDGRVQFGAQRLDDAKAAGIIPKDMTREQFRNDPNAQVAAENWHFDDIDANIEKSGYSKYIGTTINGVEVTHQGMADVQHLGGATGLKKFLESNGEYNVEDDNGTSLTDYMRAGGNAAQTQAQATAPTEEVDPIANLRALGQPEAFADPSVISMEDLAREAGVPQPESDVPLTVEQLQAEVDAVTGPDTPRVAAATPTAAAVIQQAAVPDTTAQDRYMDMIRDSKHMTGPQKIAAAEELRNAEAAGKAERKEQRKVEFKEFLTQKAIEYVNDPTKPLDDAAFAKYMRQFGGTAVEQAEAGVYALQMVGEGGVFDKVLAPDIVTDKRVVAGMENQMEILKRQVTAMPINWVLTTATTFGEKDPVNGLIEMLDLQADEHAQTPYIWGLWGADATDRNGLRNLITHIAKEGKVTRAEAAAAMAYHFQRDPSLAFNTNENRFRKQDTIEFLLGNLDPKSRVSYDGDVMRVAREQDELTDAYKDLRTLKGQRSKMTDGSAAAKLADGEIRSLSTMLKQGKTPFAGEQALQGYLGPKAQGGNGMAEILDGLPPGSPQRERAIGFIKLMIQDDPTQTPAQKKLLLATINS